MQVDIQGEQLSDRQKYDFKRALEEIRTLKGRGTELISVYVPANKQISDVAAYLREEFSQSSNIKSQGTRKIFRINYRNWFIKFFTNCPGGFLATVKCTA